MIEAVNAVISNAAYTKAVVEQQSVATSYAANPDRVQVVPQAPYISPYVHVDVNFDKAVLQLRDSETGDVVRQIPTESQLEAYKRAQAATLRSQAASAPKVETPVQSSTPIQQPIVTASVQPVQVAEAPLPSITPSETSFAPQAGSVAYTPATTTTVDTSA